MSTAQATRKKAVSVGSFGIEADNPQNCDLTIQSLSRQRLRGSIKAAVDVFMKDEEGEQTITSGAAGNVAGLPGYIPGMRLFVNPADLTYKIEDPLYGQEETLEKIRLAVKRRNNIGIADKLKGVKTKEGTLHKDHLKTLVREMVRFIESGDAKVCKGIKPRMDDVDELPGDYLTNPASNEWNQPRYEKDMPEWVESLNNLKR